MGAPTQMNGIVKAVPSGDTVVIMGVDASRGPPPEKMLTLSGISAPRLASRNAQTTDQPGAWDARQFLRKAAIGQRVLFEIDAGQQPGGGAVVGGMTPREYGRVMLAESGKSLAELLVENGWARAKTEELREAAAEAEAASLGLWSDNAQVRDVKWTGSFDTAELIKVMKGTPQDAIVEQVSSGSALRCLLLPAFQQVTLILTGVSCPGFRRGDDGAEEASPFAREARFFVESRLLHRDVQLKLEGLDKNGMLCGSVLHPAGNVSVALVKCGLAKVVDWSSSLSDHAPELRAAERDAKTNRLRLWKEYAPPNHGSDMAPYQAKVVEIVSGDTILVLATDNVERRLSLSSIRAPKMNKNSEPYAAEAKESLRKILIGKRVKITPEFKRTFPAPPGADAAAEGTTRTFCSCFYGGEKNAALVLVAEGLATVLRHRSADERSASYEALLEAEASATAAKRGVHSKELPATSRAGVTDLTGPLAKERAKSYLGTLSRGGRLRAVVHYVLNGARLKLVLPKERCAITFVLVGLRCPQCSRGGAAATDAQPYGNEALAFTKGLCFQREVEVEIENIDRSGAFLGSLYLTDKRSLGAALLREGYARRVGAAADRSAHGEELFAAEAEAKVSNLRVWENYSEEEAAAAVAAEAAEAAAEAEPLPDAQKQMVELSFTEIVDGAHFFAHVAGDASVEVLQQRLAAACLSVPTSGYEPKVGSVCCARFSHDNVWYRAKILERRKGQYMVSFIDYGNKDLLTPERLRPLEPTLGVVAMSPQAIECRLACLMVGAADDDSDGTDAAIALGEHAWGKPTLARVEYKQGDVLYVTLFQDSTNINERLVSSGAARVTKDVPRLMASLANSIRAQEAVAKSARLGMWRYGDIEEDDDFEFGTRRRDAQQAQDAVKGGRR